MKKKRKRQNNQAENETSLSEHEESLHNGTLKKKRRNHGNPSEHKSEEDSCSENNKCLNKKKGKNVHPLAGEESHSSNKAMTREAKRRR